jgi:hypothetical protein
MIGRSATSASRRKIATPSLAQGRRSRTHFSVKLSST